MNEQLQSQQYVTTDIHFAAALMTAFGEASLLQITRGARGGTFRQVPVKQYIFEVPDPADAASMYTDFLQHNLGCYDLREYVRVYSSLTKICKGMERDGLDSWESPSWTAGK